MANGAVRQLMRRLIPLRVRWLARAAFRRITGLYYRDLTDRLVLDIRHYNETQGDVLELILRRLRVSQEEVAAHLSTVEEQTATQMRTMEERIASRLSTLEENLLVAQAEVAARLSTLDKQVAAIVERLPDRIMTLAENEPFLTEHLLLQGDIFLDVGASTGTYSWNLAAGYRKVFAFEPHPRARKQLMLALTGLDNVVVKGMAVYSHTGVVRLYLYSNDAQSSVLPTHDEADAGPPVGEMLVHCVKLDDMEFDGEVHFVKIDTEGAEVEIIAGGINTIAKHKPQLLVEIHSKENGPKIQQMLGEFGYRFTRIDNPLRTPEDPYWHHHYWLSCKAPRRRKAARRGDESGAAVLPAAKR